MCLRGCIVGFTPLLAAGDSTSYFGIFQWFLCPDHVYPEWSVRVLAICPGNRWTGWERGVRSGWQHLRADPFPPESI